MLKLLRARLNQGHRTNRFPEEEPRRYPSTIGGAAYLFTLAVLVVGIAVVVGGDWRIGVRIMGGGLLFAALSRFVLPAKDAGMLHVRNRWLDGSLLALVGAALIFLATSIPNQPL